MKADIRCVRKYGVVEALCASLLVLVLLSCSTSTQPASQSLATAVADPLPSWNDGPTKQAILDFVRTTTDKSNPKFVPPEERIATFDQDGTTWVEQPIYSQVLFVFDRIAELSPQHPERKNRQPFKAVVSDDKAAMEKPNTNPTTAPNRRGIRAVRTQKM